MTQKQRNQAVRTLVVGIGLSGVALASAPTNVETARATNLDFSLSAQIAKVRNSPAASSSAIANSIKDSGVLVAECFGQSSGTNGACGYSQDAGCTYTQNCHPTA